MVGASIGGPVNKAAVGLAIIATLIATSAFAADMAVKAPPPAPPVTAPGWTGFYIGGNIGGAWGRPDLNFAPNDPAAAFVFNAGLPSTSFDTSSALGGPQVGYNWQLNRNWLVGVETDFDWSGMGGSASSTNPASFGSPTGLVSERIDWFGTVRARLAYLPTDKLLAFITGGFAYGEIGQNGTYAYSPSANAGSFGGGGGFSVLCGRLVGVPGTCFAGSSTAAATGWTLGGGLEYALWQKWSVKVEYLYVSLGSKLTESAQVLGLLGTAPATINAYGRENFNVARAGLNYHF